LDKEILKARIEELEHRLHTQGLRDAAKVELENTIEMLRIKEAEDKREFKETIERAKKQGDKDLFEHPKKKAKDDFWDGELSPPKRSE